MTATLALSLGGLAVEATAAIGPWDRVALFRWRSPVGWATASRSGVTLAIGWLGVSVSWTC